jgi:cold shock CspA family protein
MVRGVIERFDERRGDGWLRVSDGETFYFHCVSIADGTRSIAVGVRAEARRCVGHQGHDEVVDVRPVTTTHD